MIRLTILILIIYHSVFESVDIDIGSEKQSIKTKSHLVYTKQNCFFVSLLFCVLV